MKARASNFPHYVHFNANNHTIVAINEVAHSRFPPSLVETGQRLLVAATNVCEVRCVAIKIAKL